MVMELECYVVRPYFFMLPMVACIFFTLNSVIVSFRLLNHVCVRCRRLWLFVLSVYICIYTYSSTGYAGRGGLTPPHTHKAS